MLADASIIGARHRDGWCATQRRKVPRSVPGNVKTVCRIVVVAPWDVAETDAEDVTCLECQGALRLA